MTIVIPATRIDWFLWENIFGLNSQRYSAWSLLVVCQSPDIGDRVISVMKTHRRFLPENDIFVPRRVLSDAELLNAAIGMVKTDYFCLKMLHDHLHSSALASLSEALETEHDFVHTLRFKMNNDDLITCDAPVDVDDWSAKEFKYRGLFTFKKQAVMSIGGFQHGVDLNDPVLVLIYDLLDSGASIHRINEFLYMSRWIDQMNATRSSDDNAVEWRKQLIAQRWPERVEERS